jgi:hypothetical protein
MPATVQSVTDDAVAALQADHPSGDTQKVVEATLKSIQDHAELTEQQKHEVVANVARDCAQRGCQASINSPGTLLRGVDVESKFISAAMNAYSKEYVDTVKQQAQQGLTAIAHQIPTQGLSRTSDRDSAITPQNLPPVGYRPNAAVKSLDEAIALNEDYLSPEAQDAWDNY